MLISRTYSYAAPGTTRTCAGFSLIELMVGLVVAMLVTIAASAVYVTTARGARDAVNATKLNHELRAALDVMVGDIRRAGYCEFVVNTTTGSYVCGCDAKDEAMSGNCGKPGYPFNVFNQAVNATASGVLASNLTNLVITTTPQSCILYAYDATHLSTTSVRASNDSHDYFGFRLNTNSGAIESKGNDGTLYDNSSCSNGDWESLTDPNLVTITKLKFTTSGSKCLNATSKTEAAVTATNAIGRPCVETALTASTGNTMLEIRQVNIAIAGRLAGDATVTASVSQSVKLPTNRIFTQQ